MLITWKFLSNVRQIGFDYMPVLSEATLKTGDTLVIAIPEFFADEFNELLVVCHQNHSSLVLAERFGQGFHSLDI